MSDPSEDGTSLQLPGRLLDAQLCVQKASLVNCPILKYIRRPCCYGRGQQASELEQAERRKGEEWRVPGKGRLQIWIHLFCLHIFPYCRPLFPVALLCEADVVAKRSDTQPLCCHNSERAPTERARVYST